MPDWPPDLQGYGAYGVLSTAGEGSLIGDVCANTGTLFTAAVAWVTANTALFTPVLVRAPTTVYQLAWINGGTSSGNVDVGIYDANGARIVSAGSTAQGTVSVPQAVDIADTVLQPGLYYLAMAADNTTGTYMRGGSSAFVYLFRSAGMAEMATAFPLPTTATFAAYSSTFGCPLLAGAIGSAVI